MESADSNWHPKQVEGEVFLADSRTPTAAASTTPGPGHDEASASVPLLDAEPGGARAAGVWSQLCFLWAFSFLKWFKPSEAYLVEYFISKGFTNRQVYDEIFPLWQYSHLPALFAMGLLSEAIGCRPVVFIGSSLGFATTALTLGAPHGGLAWLQLSQLTVAVAFSSHSAFSALVFGCVPRSKFQLATHGCRAATLAGVCLSALLGHALKRTAGLDALFRISLIAQLATVGAACLLRSPEAEQESSSCKGGASGCTPSPVKAAEAGGGLPLLSSLPRVSSFLLSVGEDVGGALALPGILRWSCWALVGEAVHRMVLTYWQNLVKSEAGSSSSSSSSNGVFYALMYLMAALLTLAAAQVPWQRSRTAIQVLSPALCGVLLLGAARGPLLLTYAALLLFQCVHEATAATCAAQVGMQMKIAYSLATSRAVHVASSERLAAASSGAPPERRLAALFAATTLLSVAVEALVQVGMIQLGLKMPLRFLFMGVLLVALALALFVPSCVEWTRALVIGSSYKLLPSTSAEVTTLGSNSALH